MFSCQAWVMVTVRVRRKGRRMAAGVDGDRRGDGDYPDKDDGEGDDLEEDIPRIHIKNC